MITLYDFDSKTKHPWNMSVWKARYSLNFKNVPYKTIWIEYPDIEPTMKKLGAQPTGLRQDGSPLYTLPLIPRGTHALQAAFRRLIESNMSSLGLLVVPELIRKVVNAPSAEYMTSHYLPNFGISDLATWTLSEEQSIAEWDKVKELLGSVHAMMKAEDKWIMGDQISFADFAVASVFETIKAVFGKDSEEWKRVVSWHDGRWDRMMTELERYSTVY
ncbi:hypothetical protein BDP27DRAFT_1335618 [Rhodocollybia butyracea]|uniref:Glutathione S-transferase UstS-like C-terminal domain-containing protein n=1 Tax=Rhodocollybia butyracea TaxID=206335 RepID=A0A9P5PH54_9AGAR|nr:hypothetical protein BDP27DRAFT_1335618 [Rhodocollybia butyracea]